MTPTELAGGDVPRTAQRSPQSILQRYMAKTKQKMKIEVNRETLQQRGDHGRVNNCDRWGR